MADLLLFGKYDMSEVTIKDLSIKRYINLKPVVVPHTGGKSAARQFNKAEIPIVERLMNKMMRNEFNTGEKNTCYRIVRDAFEIIHKKTGQNPVQILVDAIENAGPREETVRLKYGGINVPKAVDTAPMRRVDQALMFISLGAEKAAFKSKKSVESALAEELMAAARGDVKSFSVGKKDERERVAKAAR
ncbi:30S ribosomal protein S7 [Methanocella sp. CWC-04]|uniref:Small ribosomal subunit protein uS7 n=1 Tax=Methanooceanicella nereidis TaxID=2052831 RepID=A0AAP2W6E2_9EURY|nr:30S ribosomal protein S7 [Methanocella sp. CWC-04]MCD1293996.1 30S ribosomal protein S7 [Methanocella sp. CWC-04]